MTKKIVSKILFRFTLFCVLIAALPAFSQKKYEYKTVPNDPLQARIYTLDNGLTVFLSVYRDAPRIYTAIAVRTGSKNDPPDNTGLSHYLEHMMFKGTKNYGTINYEEESIYLNKIDSLFEVYRSLTDTEERKAVYRVIDSVSNIASHYAIANEYDVMMSALGAKGTNAYTSVEQTVYINDIPSNQLERWLTIEAERFGNPVFRLFHTELETVYEEKNMSLDNDGRKVMEALMLGLYPTHTYGTQTTLGSQEHLKNPSLKSLKEYYDSRYVPNNMAIALSGEFDPDVAIRLIDEKFGDLKPRKIVPFDVPLEKPITSPLIREVFGPDAENLRIGFRLKGYKSQDADLLSILNMILNNRSAGLIDLNLVQAQKVLSASCFPYIKQDYSSHIFSGSPKSGQSLEEVGKLILEQIELVKRGEFPDWMVSAIINDMKMRELRSFENNSSRVSTMLNSFIMNMPYEFVANRLERLSRITKDDIVRFARENYGDNYVMVYKRTGVDNSVAKVEKPSITPIEVNRVAQSDFVKKILDTQVPDIEPVFLKYDKDIHQFMLDKKVPVYYIQNVENDIFNLYYIADMGNNNDIRLGLALNYLRYLGTSKYSPSEIQMEFYKLGCSFNISASDDQVYVSLTGLTGNFAQGLELFEHLLADAQPNEEALQNLIADVLKQRNDSKLSKSSILWGALYNYGVYGLDSPFRNILSEDELNSLKAGELVDMIRDLNNYEHRVLYYGTLNQNALAQILTKLHRVPKKFKPIPAEKQYKELETNTNKVFVVDYDMKQVEIVMLSKSDRYRKDNTPSINLFNEYFGRGMSSVVFQELREAKGLAYSAYATYSIPSRPDRSHYITSFIGTQNDKLPEAMSGMLGLLNNMPESERSFNTAREAIEEKIRTERITKSSILFSYERARKLGYDYDIRKDVFAGVQKMNFNDLKAFQEKYLKNKNYHVLVLGNKDQLDMNTLRQYGEVEFLTLEEIFGY
ncbi:MAG: insulinase family protein [Bacteroidales bacterium]